jgi:Carboxypeptidase regulatory-like domain
MSMKIARLLVMAAAFCAAGLAQTFGDISGIVTDSSDAVIAGANITVANSQTNVTRTAVTNTDGNYNIPSLQPGVYDVKVEKDGFRSEVRSAIELQVQQSARIDFRLNPGSVAETVEVTAGTPLLDTENATVGTVIENKRIVDLPLNGRSFVSLVGLSPNVTTGQSSNTGYRTGRGGTDRETVSLSVAGMRQEYTYYTLDGMPNQDVDWNTYAFLPSIDALEEFKVQTGVYSAEFGRETAQVNVSTKSGTNGYHGTVFEFLRNNDLDARPFAFTSHVPASAPFKWNQYGFTLGGPISIPKLFSGKDRLFFMSNYEGFKLRNQSQNVYSTAPNAMRGGDFSQLLPTTVIKDPTTGQPFPGNIIPASRLNSIAVGLLQYYPSPNVAGTGTSNNYLALDNNSTNKDQFTQRIDFVESAKSTWAGRYSFQNESVLSPALFENGTNVGVNVKQGMISNTRIFTPTLVNDFRFSYMGYDDLSLTELAYKKNVNQELGIPLLGDVPPIAYGTINVTITGFSPFGDNINSPYAANDHLFQWSDGVTWTHGTHTVKFGGDIRRDRYNALGGQVIRGNYVVQNQATGYGFSDYMLGYLQQYSAGATLGIAQLRSTSQDYYVTDSWKVRPNVTIEAGLRYEYKSPWDSRGDSYANVVVPFSGTVNNLAITNIDPSLHPYLARDCAAYGQNSFYPPESFVRFAPGIQTKCVSGLGTTIQKGDPHDFAPRLGISWSPSPAWVIRAGAGFFYAQDEANTYFDTALNTAGKASSIANLATHNLTFNNPFGPGTNTCGLPSPPYACISAPVVLGNEVNRRTPYIVTYEMNIQRQLTKSMTLEVGYLGSEGHRLERALAYNDSYPSPTGTVASRTPFPEYRLIQMTAGVSNSDYNSGSIKLTRRLANGLSLLAGYTFAKSIDDGSGIRPATGGVLNGGGESTQPQGGVCYTCDRSLSDFDTRHRVVASILYELPVGKGKPFLNHGVASYILGGWQLNSIISASSGFPIEILDGVNQTNTTLSNNRPDAVPGANPVLAHPSTSEWFNIQAFELQPFGSHYGNVGRNTIIGPGVMAWDFSTLKNFSFTEKTYLQFRFECFNCANHPNFGDPLNSLTANRTTASGLPIPGTGTFGEITSTRPGIDMREMQLSLKVVF